MKKKGATSGTERSTGNVERTRHSKLCKFCIVSDLVIQNLVDLMNLVNLVNLANLVG